MSEKPTTPGVGILVVGDDLDVCAALAGVIRWGLNFQGIGKTVAMETLTNQPSFTNFHDYRDPDDAAEEATSVWDKMCQNNPLLSHMSIPIEVVKGCAAGLSKEVISDHGIIRVGDLTFNSGAEWTPVQQ